MAGFGVSIKNEATPALNNLRKAMPKLLESGMLKVAEQLAGEVRRQVQKLLRKRPTGALAQSFRVSAIRKSKGKMSAGVFSDLPYARIQDIGGPIVARTRKPGFKKPWLFIPQMDKSFRLVERVDITGVNYTGAAIREMARKAPKELEGPVKFTVEGSIRKAKGSR